MFQEIEFTFTAWPPMVLYNLPGEYEHVPGGESPPWQHGLPWSSPTYLESMNMFQEERVHPGSIVLTNLPGEYEHVPGGESPPLQHGLPWSSPNLPGEYEHVPGGESPPWQHGPHQLTRRV